MVWGQISNASANWRGIPLPSRLKYREWQLYVPGVYHQDRPSELRTYVPRIYVDHYLPEVLGRKFYYKKIEVPEMRYKPSFDASDRGGLSSAEFMMQVTALDKTERTWEQMKESSREWRALLEWLPGTDIMGEAGAGLPPRYSAFAWGPRDIVPSLVRTSEVEMNIWEPLLRGMDPRLMRRAIRSIASFAVSDWYFWVNNDFVEGPMPKEAGGRRP